MFHNDSIHVSRAIAKAAGGFNNPYTGLGTERNPLSHTQIGSSGELSLPELELLYQQHHLIQKIAYIYPLEGIDHWCRYTFGTARKYGSYGVADSDLQGYLDSRCSLNPEEDPILHKGSLRSLFFEATLNARIFGNGYLILGIDDGGDWTDPVRSDRIISLRWIEVVTAQELRPFWQGHFDSEFYELTRWSFSSRATDEIKTQLIHRSRVIEFSGVYLPFSSRRKRAGKGLSVLQSVWRALARVDQSMDASAYLLQSASFFEYGLKGLSNIQDESIKKLIEGRFQSITMSLSVLKGIIRDAETESVGFASRQFGGVDKLLSILIDQLAMECDVPRYKILEISDQGGLNGNKGESERFLWSQVLDAWRSRQWRTPMLYLGKIAMLAKDSPTKGRAIKDLSIDFPSSQQFTPQEALDMRESHLRAMTSAMSMGILDKSEIRSSTYGSDWSFNISLDDRVTAQIEGQKQKNRTEEL